MVRRYFGLLLFLLFLSSCCSEKKANENENTFPAVTIQTANGPVSFFVELARTPEEKERGLMFRNKLAVDHGMLFLYEQEVMHPFWMKNTPIGLDILFIDKESRIVFITQKTRPLSEALITSPQPYRAALEVNSGLAERFQIKAGDRVSFDSTVSK